MSNGEQGMSNGEQVMGKGRTHYPETRASLLIAHHLLTVFIIVAYLLTGILYAVRTPPWQAPDEPAHYNYVKYLAENHRLPVLQMGDYPHDYLEEIKAKRFPPEMSVDHPSRSSYTGKWV